MMTRPPPFPHRLRHLVPALLAALAVGATGAYPHVRWSLEVNQVAWFFNSYDEGYYGWLAVSAFSPFRPLSDGMMHMLYWLAGANAQGAMILADFLLPAAVTLAACYLVRPLFTSTAGMIAGALWVVLSAECLALRSTSVPYSFLHDLLREKLLPLTGGPAGVLQLENQTSTFWLFRTPEPQLSWIILFLFLGWILRIVQQPVGPRLPWSRFLGLAALAGTSYLFCALGLGAALLLFAALAIRTAPRLALLLGAGGVVCVGVCLAFSYGAARQAGAESLVFRSHRPVVMLSVVIGLAAAATVALRGWQRRELTARSLLAIALGLAPMGVANQQVVTGRMIYLINFENFSLAQLAALSCLLAIGPAPGRPFTNSRWRTLVPAGALLLLGGMLLHSQWLSYGQFRETNRVAWSYARTLQALPAGPEFIICDDFFATDTLALRLAHRPRFLLARDTIFFRGISRLSDAATPPANGSATRLALFEYLALTGTSAEDLARRFESITDPSHPSWQDRFLLGGFLYNHADFWSPLTHGRDLKLPWIAGQKAGIVADYRRFLAESGRRTEPMIYLLPRDKAAPEFLARRGARPLAFIAPDVPIPIQAFRLDGAVAPPPP